MPYDRTPDFKSIRIDSVFFSDAEYRILENFPRGDNLHTSTVANAVNTFLERDLAAARATIPA